MSQTAARSNTPKTGVSAVLGLLVVVVAIVGILVLAAPTVTGVARGSQWSEGALPSGVTVFDDAYPGVARLDAGLLKALRRAATEAASEGIEIYVNSGWRSPAYQGQLLREAVSEYGSAEEAARWVASATTSPHVAGQAADIGESEAAAWLSHRGAPYGLCQIYRNEPWHYELRPAAATRGCPRMYADPTQDPRMKR
jgi:D-alanyl-D-alanine carboxypeptidase